MDSLVGTLVRAVVMLVVMGGAGAVIAQGSRRLKLLWLAFVIAAIWGMRS